MKFGLRGTEGLIDGTVDWEEIERTSARRAMTNRWYAQQLRRCVEPSDFEMWLHLEEMKEAWDAEDAE